jgi:hypothetical protein
VLAVRFNRAGTYCLSAGRVRIRVRIRHLTRLSCLAVRFAARRGCAALSWQTLHPAQPESGRALAAGRSGVQEHTATVTAACRHAVSCHVASLRPAWLRQPTRRCFCAAGAALQLTCSSCAPAGPPDPAVEPAPRRAHQNLHRRVTALHCRRPGPCCMCSCLMRASQPGGQSRSAVSVFPLHLDGSSRLCMCCRAWV